MSFESFGYREPEGEKKPKEALKQPELPEDLSTAPTANTVKDAIQNGYLESEKARMVVASNIANTPENQAWLAERKKVADNGYYDLAKWTDTRELYLRWEFTKIFEWCFWKDCPSHDEIEREYKKIKNWPDFDINTLKNSQLWLETPLLDPLDIILLFIAFGEILWKLGLKVLMKWCSLIVEGWKVALKTSAWEKVELAGKAARNILEKYKDKLKGFWEGISDVFEPVTTNWMKVPGKVDKMRNTARAISTGEWADYVETAFNKLLNRMIFRNMDWDLIRNREFLWKIEELANDINVNDFLDPTKQQAFRLVMIRIKSFLVNRWKEIWADKVLQNDVQVALRRISDTMSKAKDITKTQKNDIIKDFTSEGIDWIKKIYTLIWL